MSEQKTLLLFDVDGVLILPRGYKEALKANVDHFAARMGQKPVGLTYEEIAVFESVNMTNEWVSGAMCVAALVVTAARHYPDLISATFDATVENIRREKIRIPRPDFTGLTRHIYQRFPNGVHASSLVLEYLLDKAPETTHPVLRELLESVFPPESVTSRVFQHYTLGHAGYEKTYQQTPSFETDSFLELFDRRGLSERTVKKLLGQVENGRMAMAIYTARPSLPPVDLLAGERQSLNMADYPPEGDAAVHLLGFNGIVPLIAAGRLMWLASQLGQAPHTFVKPSPVHALAAIAAAWSGEERGSLMAAADLVLDGEISGAFAEMGDTAIRVVVFEDSTGGLRGGHQAGEYMRRVGMNVRVEGVGVAPEKSKRKTLQTIADRTVGDLETGLRPYLTG